MEPTGKRPPQGGGEPLSPSSTKAKAVELPSAAAAPRSRSRTLLIITALMAAVAVVSGGGGYAIGYITAPKSMDMDAELRRIEETCTQEDLLTGETLSAECAALVDDRVRALEQLVHAGGAAEFVPSNATHGHRSLRSRQLSSKQRCTEGLLTADTAKWVDNGGSGCCAENRPGKATGPSPICRVIMHSCADPDTQSHCSWWNGFCWGLCSSYDYVDYCGYCGVPMASTNPPTEI